MQVRHRTATARWKLPGRPAHNGQFAGTLLDGVFYPSEDGQPMGQSHEHNTEIMRTFQTLEDRYAAGPDVYIGADLLVFYEEGNPAAVVVPDTMVVFGVPKLPPRASFFIWVEGAIPQIMFEIASKKTRLRDIREKRRLYELIGVREYVVYDIAPGRRRPPLRLFRLVDGVYFEIEPDANGELYSEQLDLRLRLINGRLRFYDNRTGVMLRSPAERTLEAEAAQAVALAEMAQAQAGQAEAEARAARLEAEIAELRRRLTE